MSSSMLQFVRLSAAMPEKREAEERTLDFNEIYRRFQRPEAAAQASRCEQCGIPFCQIHCPLQNNIPDWLMLASAGRLEEAYRVSSATNSMPEICGRICPQDRLCEGMCVLEQSTHESVTIGAVEKFITDTAWDEGWVQGPKPAIERRQSIGVIGSGPGGLAAAERLRAKGFQVHVYDRHDRAGGLLIYGIPSFKLEKDIVERRTRLLADSGVVFHQNFEVGREASLDDLRRKHVALVIATGVYQPRPLSGVPGADLPGVHRALDYLIASNRAGFGDAVAPELNAEDKRVVVIGGGDTAMDCVRTAIRQGAKSVTCLYRRDRANMPGSQREVKHAEEEGVRFVWQTAPEMLTGEGSVSGVVCVKMHLGVPDSSGRQTPSVIEGSHFTEPAEFVVSALGFEPEDLPQMFGAPDLTVSRWGTLKVDPSLMTSLPGVFAAGDIVRGASLVVWAIKDGRDAADSVERYLDAKSPRQAAAE